jgi:hypothetical protein
MEVSLQARRPRALWRAGCRPARSLRADPSARRRPGLGPPACAFKESCHVRCLPPAAVCGPPARCPERTASAAPGGGSVSTGRGRPAPHPLVAHQQRDLDAHGAVGELVHLARAEAQLVRQLLVQPPERLLAHHLARSKPRSGQGQGRVECLLAHHLGVQQAARQDRVRVGWKAPLRAPPGRSRPPRSAAAPPHRPARASCAGAVASPAAGPGPPVERSPPRARPPAGASARARVRSRVAARRGAAPPLRARRASCRCAGWRARPTRQASPCAQVATVSAQDKACLGRNTNLARLDSCGRHAAAWQSTAGARAGTRAAAQAPRRGSRGRAAWATAPGKAPPRS